jgi:LEA14-like dessication related protein
MLFLLLTGCGVDLSGLAPTIRFERMDVRSVDFEHIDTDFVFAVDNPNPVGSPVDRFAYSLSLMGVEILSGDDPNGLELAAGGTSEVALPVGLDFANLWEAITATRGEDYVGFGLQGGIGLDTDLGPVDVAFDEEGSFPAVRIPKLTLGTLKLDAFDGTNLDLGLNIDVDNDHGSALDFADIAFDLDLAGVNVGQGAMEETVSVEGASSKTVKLPISINVFDAAEAAADILAGNPIDVKLDLRSDVNTPFGVLPLHVDQSGNVRIEE